MMKFEVGDVACLKSDFDGLRPMVVSNVCERRIECVYFLDDGELTTVSFPAIMFEKWETGK